MKIVAIILAVILVVLSFGLAVHYNQNALTVRRDLDRERYSRIVAEENLDKASVRMKSLETEIAKLQKKSQSTEKSLGEIKESSADLERQLDQLIQTRTSLETKVTELERALSVDSQIQPIGSTGGGDAI